MLEALRFRDFRLLWTARLVSQLGSWLLVVAVPAQVLAIAGSVAATGLTLAAQFLPPTVLGGAGGAARRGRVPRPACSPTDWIAGIS